jgi:hypothetical protein
MPVINSCFAGALKGDATMAALSEWDASELERIEQAVARYKFLRTKLHTSVHNKVAVPRTEIDEFQQLESALADDMERLLSMIARLQL